MVREKKKSKQTKERPNFTQRLAFPRHSKITSLIKFHYRQG